MSIHRPLLPITLLALGGPIVFASTARAQVSPQTPTLIMRDLSTIPGGGPSGQVMGPDVEKVNSTQWPSTFHFQYQPAGAAVLYNCTATAVSARVVLTAAHCVDDGMAAAIAQGPINANLQCWRHPTYQKNSPNDFALCLTDRALHGPFEAIESDTGLEQPGSNITILGFGCRQPHGPITADLYKGHALIYYTPESGGGGFIVTQGKDALCSGDSGGAAYSHDDAGRRIVGVNALSDMATTSWLAPTSGDPFQTWATRWTEYLGAAICGLHNQINSDCRQ